MCRMRDGAYSQTYSETPAAQIMLTRLNPGDTYNFTMALVSGTTWEFVVNDTLIQEKPGRSTETLSGLFDTTSTTCNEGADFGLETLTAWGGNVGITNMISIPMVMSFQVNGQWSEPSSFSVRVDWRELG